MSKTWCARLKRPSSFSRSAGSARPSPSCMRSCVVSVRAEDVITSVRSGEAMPLPIWRAVSSSSEETIASERARHRVQAEHGPPAAQFASGTGNTSR
jgi:hypothetical protein